MGHCGTLDPLASGLLLVVLGSGTKLQSYLTGFDKSYTFTFKLGFSSDTLDSDGVVEEITSNFEVSFEDVKNAAKLFEGETLQVPPLISAKKFKGKPLYQYARSGQGDQIDLKQFAQKVTLKNLHVVSVQGNEVSMSVDCSKGTFIRSLARDIAKSLGTTAVVTKLHRTRVQKFDLENTVSSDSLLEMSIDEIEAKVIPLHKINSTAFLPVVVESGADIQKLRFGNVIRDSADQIFERFSISSKQKARSGLRFTGSEQIYIFFEPDYSPIGLGNLKKNGINFEIKLFRGLQK